MASNGRYLYGKNASLFEEVVQQIAAAGGLRTEITSGKEAPTTLMPDSPLLALRKATEQTAENLGKESMQKRKEDQMEEKSTVDYAEVRKKNAEKALADYDRRMGFDDRTAQAFKKYDDQRNRLQMEANRENDKYVQLRDTADIEAMAEEERQALEQYAVNRVRDQNLPLEMQGMMPTARQEAAGLVGKYGTRADELAETFMREENAELAQQAEAAGRKFAEEKPVLASTATIPVNLMAAITGTVGQLQGAARATGRYSTMDANETGTALDVFSGSVRDQTAQNIEGDVYDENGNLVKDGGNLRKLGSLAYQGGMSFLDSMARMLASGGSSGISSAIAASGAFSQGLQKYSAMGASPEQAAMAATASAGLEYITEKLPTDKVLKIFQKGGNQNAVKEVLKQAFLVEPTGEEVNLFAGMAAEALILGENSSKQQRIGDLIAGGMTKAEAEKQFWKETFQEAVNTYAVSGFAGLFGGGAAAYAGKQVQTRQDQQPTVAPAAPKATPAPPVAPPVETAQQEVKPEAATPAPEAPASAPVAKPQDPLQMAIESVTRPETQPDIPQNTPTEQKTQPEVAPNPDYYDEFEDFNAGGATEPVASVSNVQASASNTEATTGSTPTADNKTMPAEGGQPQIKGTGAAEGNFSGKPAYNATLSEDNAQADRRNDVRPMELPALDINVGNVSAVTGDVYASRNTPDDLAAAMEEPVAKGDFSYVRISNDVATQRARQSIGDAGSWETARDHFRMDVDKGLAGAELSARGALILNHAAEVYEQAKASGDTQAAARAKKEWLKILSDVQKLGTNTAQGLQAMRIIRDLMPQDKIQFTRIAVENMVRDMRIDTDIQIDEQLLTEYENAATDQQRDEIMEKIQQNVADQIPSTWLDKWNALRYTNMLGNLKTNVRNIAGNVANSAVYRMKDATGAVLETIANKVSNGKVGRTKSVVVNKQIRKACAEYYQQVKNAVGSGGKYGDNNTAAGDFAQGVMDRRQIFKFKPMEGYRKATNWMMNNERFGDEAFGKTAFARAMAGYLQANGVRNEADIRNASPDLIDKAMVYAVKEAQETTFHDNSALANVLGRLKKDAGIVGEGLIPFTKTPANVLTRAEEYSPIGLINTAITAYKAAKPGSDVTGTDVINSLSKSLTGTAIFALGAILQSQGILNGGPDDDEEQAAFDKMNGIQPYSINLPNGTTYTLDWLTPIAMPLFMGAQLMDIASEKDLTFADLERVFTSIADPMIQMSMMQGINSSLENIKYSENNMGQFFINAAVSYLTQGLTNTLLGQVERSSEENRMTTYIDKDSSVPQWMQQALGKASQKVPGWDYQQTEYVDAWGETQKNEGGFFYNLLSPGYSQKVRDDTVTRELNRLKAAGVEENVFPDMASATVTWTDKKGTVHENDNLTAEQHQTLAKTQGQTSRELLEDMFASKDYAALTDAQKAKAINSAYLYARKTGEIAAIDGHTGYDQTWMMDVKKKGANEILRRAFNSDLSGAMSALDSAWDNGYNEETFNRELQNAYDSYSKATPAMKKQVYEEAEGTTKRYLEARSKGISHSDFVAVAKSIATVKGTGSINKDTGKATVRDIDKRKAIANTKGMTSSEIDILMKAYMPDYDPKAASPEMTELKYQYIREEMGLSPKEYATTYQAYLDADKKNKIAAIRALGYDHSTANALYRLYNGSMKKDLLKLYG